MDWSQIEARSEGGAEARGVAVLVLGMHRSGTSAISGVLNMLGAETPGELIPPSADNERGFFENRRLVILNDRILAHLGSSWDDPLPLSSSWLRSPVGQAAHRDLLAAIGEEFGQSSFVTVKDPRICRLAPLWLGALQEAGLRTVAVLAVRHPLEVAKSTAGRNGMPRSQTLLAWLDHTLSAERSTRGLKRSFLRYDDLLVDWRSEVKRIGTQIDIVWSHDPMRIADDVDRFLGADLRHHNAAGDSLNAEDSLERVCASVWQAVSMLRDKPFDADSQHVFDDAWAQLNSSIGVLAPLARSQMQRLRLGEAAFEELRRTADGALEDLRQTRERSAALAEEVHKLWVDRDRVEADLRDERERAERELRAEREVREHLTADNEDARGHIGALTHELQATRDHSQAVEWETHHLRTRLAGIEGSTSWRLTRPLRTLMEGSPLLRTGGRRVLRGSWWLVTGQIVRRMRERRAILAALAQQGPALLDASPAPSDARHAEVETNRFAQAAEFRSPDVVLQVPFEMTLAEPQTRVAVLCHMFHHELATEVLEYLKSIEHADLFVSTDTEAKRQRLMVQFGEWSRGSVEIRVVPNRGRDIAPKLVAFKDVYAAYEVVLHVHSKKSTHSSTLALWRPYLFETLLGSKDIVRSILHAFERDPKLGAVVAEHFEPVSHHINWGGNAAIAQDMAARMGFAIDATGAIDFPSGSMFWMRSAMLKPLLSLGLSFDDFPDEVGQVDATRAHAIERLYFFVCEAAGFRRLKIARPEFFSRPLNACAVFSDDELERLAAVQPPSLFSPVDRQRLLARPQPVEKAARGLLHEVQKRHLGLNLPVPEVSVCVGVVTYDNAESEMRRLLGSIGQAARHMPAGARVETLVIDNGTSTTQWAHGTDATRHVEAIGNVGFGRAHNHLMKMAFADGADLYIAANPDGSFHPDAISSLVRMSAANRHRALIEATQFPVEHPKPYDMGTFVTPWASGACLMIPRSLYEATGGFDDSFFMYAEDVDLSWRVRAAGYEVKIAPTALFLHAVTNRTMSPETLRMIYESGSVLARRWGGRDFLRWLEKEAALSNIVLPAEPVSPVPNEWWNVADFSHHFSFAKARW